MDLVHDEPADIARVVGLDHGDHIVGAGDSVDLLSATLDTSASVATEVHTHGWSEWVIWGVSGALLLMTGIPILFAVRRHKRAKKGI